MDFFIVEEMLWWNRISEEVGRGRESFSFVVVGGFVGSVALRESLVRF